MAVANCYLMAILRSEFQPGLSAGLFLLLQVRITTCAYYGISGNFQRLSWYAYQVARIWQKWLSRRDRGSRLHWTRFTALRKRHPLPAARIVHRYTFASETLP
jgi:hypothetical protein